MGFLDRLLARKPATSEKPRTDSGRAHTDGFLELDELNAELAGRSGLRIFDKMWRTDPDVRRSVSMAANPVTQGTWSSEPKGGKDADEQAQQIADDFAWALGLGDDNADSPLDGGWGAHLGETLPLLIRSGFTPSEIVWGRRQRDGRDLLCPVKLGVRLPRTVYKWNLDDASQELVSIEQLRITRAGMPSDPSGFVTLPRQDILYYRIGAEGDNWEGQSMLRPIYKPWKLKDQIERLDAIAQEREAVGLPVVYPPQTSAIEPAILDQLEEDLAALRRGELAYLIMPGPHAENTKDGVGWRLDIMGLAGEGSSKRDPLSSLNYHRDQIASAFLQEFMRLGQNGEGARATADVQQDPYMMACQALADIPRLEANRILARRFAILNYGEGAPIPSLRVALSETDLAALREYVAGLAAFIHPDDPTEDFLRERAHLPAADPEAREQRKQAEEDTRQAELEAQKQPGGAEREVLTTRSGGPEGKPSRERVVEKTRTLDDAPAAPAPVSAKAAGELQVTENVLGGCGCNKPGCKCAGGEHCTYEGKRTLDRGHLPDWLDTDAIARTLDEFPDQMAAAGAVAVELAADVVTAVLADKRPPAPIALAALFDARLNHVADTGYRLVLAELAAQAGGLGATLADGPGFDMGRRALAAAASVIGRLWNAVTGRHLDGATDTELREYAAEQMMTALRSAAAEHAAAALNEGRERAAQEHADLIRGSRYTSILDRSRCEKCKAADDGVLRALDDPVRVSRRPPNRRCDSIRSGQNRCRCIEFYELHDEAPAYLDRDATGAIVLAADWDPKLHPRDEDGRFRTKLSGHAAEIIQGLLPEFEASPFLTSPSGSVTRPLAGKTTKTTQQTKKGTTFTSVSHEAFVSGKGATELATIVQHALDTKAYKQSANPSSARQGLERAQKELHKVMAAADAAYGAPDAPTPTKGPPDFTAIPDEDVGEPPLPDAAGKSQSAGLILTEPHQDGDLGVWLVKPKGGYGGYDWTFPKGGVEPGHTVQQTAHKELWEESGLTGNVEGFLGDYAGDTTTTRFYVGEPTGGHPTTSDETEEVKLVPLAEAAVLLNKPRDQKVLADLKAKIKADGEADGEALAALVGDKQAPIPDLPDLLYQGPLGGTTGAKLYADEHGNKFVVKHGTSAAHIREEAVADSIYKALGVPVPDFSLQEDANGQAVKVARFVEGDTLASLPPAAKANARLKLRDHFVLDALLANWDVNGAGDDNIIVDQDHESVRIDNGGALRYRAQGAEKGIELTTMPLELWTMREQGSAKSVYGGMTDADVMAQVPGVLDKRDAIISAAEDASAGDPQLAQILNERLDGLQTIHNFAKIDGLVAARKVAEGGVPAGKPAPNPDETADADLPGLPAEPLELQPNHAGVTFGDLPVGAFFDPHGTADVHQKVSATHADPMDDGGLAHFTAAFQPDQVPAIATAPAKAPNPSKAFPANTAGLKLADLAPGDMVQWKKGGHKHKIIGPHDYSPNYLKVQKIGGGPIKGWNKNKVPYSVLKGDGSTPAPAPDPLANLDAELTTNTQIVGDLPEGAVLKNPKPGPPIVVKGESTGGSGYWAYPVNGEPKFKLGPQHTPTHAHTPDNPQSVLAAAKAKQSTPSLTGGSAATAASQAAANADPFAGTPDGSSALAKIEQWHGSIASKLTQQQAGAVGSYKSGSGGINGALRKIAGQTKVSPTSSDISYLLQAAQIDQAIHAQDPNPEAVIIYRHTDHSNWDDAAVGDLLSDGGFLSCSALPGATAGFGSITLRILAPKGTRGIWAKAATGSHQGEAEFILARDSKLVVRRRTQSGGAVTLDVELLH